jgi:hypothetical protein
VTVYADLDFYESEYLAGRSAAVTAADFAYYAQSASKVIDTYTFGNINPDNVPEEVRMCCCELTEILYKIDTSQAENKQGVASESVQGWSQSYESSQARQQAAQSSQRDIIRKWLSGTGLLYSGVK